MIDYSELYTRNQLSYHSLRNCGFQEAPATSLPAHLYKVQQTQQNSCLRDTILVALKNFIKLQNILQQAGTTKQWKFYHIVICTMPDRISKVKRKQALQQIIRLNSLWQVADFRTFFIPIDMVDAEVEEVMNICEFGGPSWVSYPCLYNDFHEQFRQIVREMGLDGKQSLMNSDANMEENHFMNPFEVPCSLAITLSIAANDRLKGEKWEGMVNTIAYYMRNLTSRDLLSGIIYSNQPWVVGGFSQPVYLANQQQRIPFQPRNIAIPVEPRPQYQQYAQPMVIQQQQAPNNCGRSMGICCFTTFITIVIWVIIANANTT